MELRAQGFYWELVLRYHLPYTSPNSRFPARKEVFGINYFVCTVYTHESHSDQFWEWGEPPQIQASRASQGPVLLLGLSKPCCSNPFLLRTSGYSQGKVRKDEQNQNGKLSFMLLLDWLVYPCRSKQQLLKFGNPEGKVTALHSVS